MPKPIFTWFMIIFVCRWQQVQVIEITYGSAANVVIQ
jgi:hypothetical protein